MDCKRARFIMHLYMDDCVSPEELEPFIKHINNCPDCHEELEISYIMLEGMRRLENGDNIAVNFQEELKSRLKKQLVRIQRQRRIIFQTVLLAICISLFGILLGHFEQEAHAELVMNKQLNERGQYYFYENSKKYIYEMGNYTPPSLREIIYGK